MTENELFEQWFNSGLRDPDAKTACESAWIARAELTDKEKAELQAKINELREAAENYALEGESALPALEQSLAKTPPQCLQEHDNEVIERCAKVCEENPARDKNNWVITGQDIASQIRGLKGKQNE